MDWQDRPRFTVFDSAFGTGERFRALVKAWADDPRRPARLHYIALDASPLPGFRRLPQDQQAITLDLLSAPLNGALAQLDARLDLIDLHGLVDAGSAFARTLARLAAPGAIVQAQDLTETQAHALGGAGFALGESEGGRIAGVFTSRKPPSPWARKSAPMRRALVLGAGLAGSAACERLCARGWEVTLIERHAAPAQEASGNQAGIFMPLLSRDDNLMTRLSRASFLYALAYWDKLGGLGGRGIAGARCGVFQLARDAAHAQVQRAISSEHAYPLNYAHWFEPGEASAFAGMCTPHGAWLFPQAGWARPSSVCAAMLDACGPALVRRFGAGQVSLERMGDEWIARGSAGVVASAPVVIVANGVGAMQLAQTASLPLSQVRGQVTHLAKGTLPALPFVLCREAYVTPAVGSWHSAGATYDKHHDLDLREDSQRDNLAKVRSLMGDTRIAADAPLEGRVGFRCMAPDRLPLVGALPGANDGVGVERLRQIARLPGLYGLLGYASRGLTWAPLAAELLASQLDGDPLPLETELATALDPARFILRARRRSI